MWSPPELSLDEESEDTSEEDLLVGIPRKDIELRKGDVLGVKIDHVVNTKTLYVLPLHTLPDLERMESRMEETYEKWEDMRTPIYAPRTGQLCVYKEPRYIVLLTC